MFEGINRIKERIETINNNLKNLHKFPASKQSELFGKLIQPQIKVGSAVESIDGTKSQNGISKEAIKELTEEINGLINKFSDKYGNDKESIKKEIGNILDLSDKDGLKNVKEQQDKINNQLNNLLTMQLLGGNSSITGNVSNLNGINIYSNNIK